MSATVEKPDKEERRREILDAAFLEFSKKGYAGASMEAIARRAHASKETLYAWFENKETLLNTLIASRIDAMANRVVPAAEKDPSPANVLPIIAEDTLRIHARYGAAQRRDGTRRARRQSLAHDRPNHRRRAQEIRGLHPALPRAGLCRVRRRSVRDCSAFHNTNSDCQTWVVLPIAKFTRQHRLKPGGKKRLSRKGSLAT